MKHYFFIHHCSKSFATIYFYLIFNSIIAGCHAFHSTPRTRIQHPYTSLFGTTYDEINRRELFEYSTKAAAGVIAASSFIKPKPARAVTATAIKPESMVTKSKSLCDPAVSTWTKSYDNNRRTVHILGTAHISAESAELAGRLVREIQPSVVFVELDAKRVKKAIPGLVSSGKTEASSNNVESNESASRISAFTSTPNNTSNESNSSPIINIGAEYVGTAFKNMYGKLESEGFKAGDEFAMSVREGLAIGSTIVLGDRDVEVTLRRLTKALSKTDIRKLLSSDTELEKITNELLPENLKSQMLKNQNSQRGNVGVGIGKIISDQSSGEVEVDKADFTSFVETMKEKENVKKIMAALQKTAPEIYEAMVAERDLYMAKGLDELNDNLKSDAKDTVAVMGMAHVDGVERYLLSQGWTEKRYSCPVAS